MSNLTRDRIVDAAEDAFFRDGVRAVTMDELAESLTMSKRTVYLHFRSKKELLREVIFRRTRRIDEMLGVAVSESSASFPGKFRKVLQKLAEAVPQPSLRFMQDMKMVVPEVWEELNLERQRILASHIGPLIDEGKRRGALREDLDSELVLRMFLSMVHGLINPGVLSELPISAPQLLDLIVSVLTVGVFTPDTRQELLNTGPTSEARS